MKKITEIYVDGGSVLLKSEDGDKYTLGYDYTGLGGSIDEVVVIKYVEDECNHCFDNNEPNHLRCCLCGVTREDAL